MKVAWTFKLIIFSTCIADVEEFYSLCDPGMLDFP